MDMATKLKVSSFQISTGKRPVITVMLNHATVILIGKICSEWQMLTWVNRKSPSKACTYPCPALVDVIISNPYDRL
jgi:hypothetical protein